MPHDIYTIDCQYIAPQKCAAYLIVEGGRAAFVDNNTAKAAPLLLDALASAGLAADAVEYLIVTHVHLDHAGGTAEMARLCPNATVLAHPRAARHIVDPARLVASAKTVYGDDLFAELYGEIVGVDESRVRTMEDNEELRWGNRTLRFLHTRGHANHHFAIYDSGSNTIFTGDAFGIGLNEAVRPGPQFIVCSTTPTDFDAEAYRIAARRIVETGADSAYLGHFGEFTDLPAGAEQLIRSIDAHESIMNTMLQDPGVNGEKLVYEAVRAHLEWCGVSNVESDLYWLAGDIAVNAMGLNYAAHKAKR